MIEQFLHKRYHFLQQIIKKPKNYKMHDNHSVINIIFKEKTWILGK